MLLGDGNCVTANQSGSLFLQTTLTTSGKETELSLVLHNVLFVPDLLSNLISCSRLCDNGYIINFSGSMCTGMYDGFMHFQGAKSEGVYNLFARCVYPWSSSANNVTGHVTGPSHPVSNLPSSPSSSYTNLHLWHARLGQLH